jgi:hypothetical protein
MPCQSGNPRAGQLSLTADSEPLYRAWVRRTVIAPEVGRLGRGLVARNGGSGSKRLTISATGAPHHAAVIFSCITALEDPEEQELEMAVAVSPLVVAPRPAPNSRQGRCRRREDTPRATRERGDDAATHSRAVTPCWTDWGTCQPRRCGLADRCDPKLPPVTRCPNRNGNRSPVEG